MKTMFSPLNSLLVAVLVAGFAFACGGSGISVPRTTATGGASPSGGAGSVGGDSGGSGGAGGTSAISTGGSAGSGGSPSDASPLPVCADVLKTPAVDSCARPVGGWGSVPPGSGTTSVKLVGTITAVAKGPVTGGCLQPGSTTTGEIVALTVHADSDAGAADWDVEYQVPANNVTWKAGQRIDVAYTQSGGGWVPLVSALTLNVGQAVDVYIGIGGRDSDLSDVPLTFRQGPAICLEHHTCGDWSGYDLEVKDAGGWLRLPYGATTSVAGYAVVHGGMAEQLTANTACADWYVSQVRVAVLRGVNAN